MWSTLKNTCSSTCFIHTYIHTTKFIERQCRKERIGGAGAGWLGSESWLEKVWFKTALKCREITVFCGTLFLWHPILRNIIVTKAISFLSYLRTEHSHLLYTVTVASLSHLKGESKKAEFALPVDICSLICRPSNDVIELSFLTCNTAISFITQISHRTWLTLFFL